MIDNNTLTIVGVFAAWTLHVAVAAWWLSGQFSSVRSLVYSQTKKLDEKFNAHELSDMARFTTLEASIKHHGR